MPSFGTRNELYYAFWRPTEVLGRPGQQLPIRVTKKVLFDWKGEGRKERSTRTPYKGGITALNLKTLHGSH